MAQVSTGGDPVTDELFEFLYLRKSSVDRPRPNHVLVYPDIEHATSAGHEYQFAYFVRESRQEFLCHPRRPEQPTALSAIFDFDPR